MKIADMFEKEFDESNFDIEAINKWVRAQLEQKEGGIAQEDDSKDQRRLKFLEGL